MIISNATPLITFARINQLYILQQVTGSLTIPEGVFYEIAKYNDIKPGVIHLNQEKWIQVKSVQSRGQVDLLLPTLELGEAEVITLALEQRARLVLMDELTGRQIAQSLGLTITGSIGILIKAKELGLIDELKPLINEMTNQGIYFSKTFIDNVLNLVGER